MSDIKPQEEPVNDPCMYESGADIIILGNSLCRVVWRYCGGLWNAAYDCRTVDGWQTLARDPEGAACGIVVRDGSDVHASPHSRPEVIYRSDRRIEIMWRFKAGAWDVACRQTIEEGDRHILEEVVFTAREASQVRYQRAWQAEAPEDDFYEWVVNTLTHNGWRSGAASFLILTHQGEGGWRPSGGGGGFVRSTTGFERNKEGFHTPGPGAVYTVFHRAPHQVEQEGWIDTADIKVYRLQHYLILYPDNLFCRDAIDYVRKLQPLEALPPRWSWKAFIDKQVEGVRQAPGLWEDHGDWGHTELGWYMGASPDAFIQKERQALDWGGNFDLWQAMAFHEIGRRFGDAWASERAGKIFNGIKQEMWQIDDPGTPCDGAFWMFRPRTRAAYEARKTQHFGGVGSIEKSADLWICDSGKIGYWLAEMSVQLDDDLFLEKSEGAAAFLMGLQRADGSLRAGRIHVSGKPVYASNLACNACALMIWARLYEITGRELYRDAAIRCADYTMAKWLNGRVWKMYGGEWDVRGNISSSSAAYATWGFAVLFRATGYEPALDAVRWSADWHMAMQSLTDTGIRHYMPKARWKGRKFRSTGGFAQGVMNEGYGQLLWNRPEEPYAQYLAWKVTGDPLYLESAKAYLVWQTYMQHDCPDDYRFHGGGSEGYEWSKDTLNGFGTVYFGETVGCNITLFALMDEGSLTW